MLNIVSIFTSGILAFLTPSAALLIQPAAADPVVAPLNPLAAADHVATAWATCLSPVLRADSGGPDSHKFSQSTWFLNQSVLVIGLVVLILNVFSTALAPTAPVPNTNAVAPSPSSGG